ncbi:unnamed protein product [Caenorhabditis angaria]|uniref:MPN domain-containing protein n=1 Tax=Caenorhabditis angaria TaxID=860376 RepID=A0A9P1J4B0_9PELO|nr:unnamed protein product [Caenorhabditis angaria]CAI5456033.1 unnamed protein product [Caenorhabditis angaria]
MASNITIKVHPLVHMTIVDSYIRITKEATDPNDHKKTLGTLMGFYEKGIVQVTNCYAIPFKEDPEHPEIDDKFNKMMLSIHEQATPHEQPVGWFFTTSDITVSCAVYHDYYTRIISEIPQRRKNVPIILITFDVTLSEENSNSLPMRAFYRTKAGIPGGREPHCAIFNPLRIELSTFEGERATLQFLQKATGSARRGRGITLEDGFKKIEETTDDIIGMLERLLEYVQGVIANGEKPKDILIGRQIKEMLNSCAIHMDTEKIDKLFSNSLRDYLMVQNLTELAKTHLNLHHFAK